VVLYLDNLGRRWGAFDNLCFHSRQQQKGGAKPNEYGGASLAGRKLATKCSVNVLATLRIAQPHDLLQERLIVFARWYFCLFLLVRKEFLVLRFVSSRLGGRLDQGDFTRSHGVSVMVEPAEDGLSKGYCPWYHIRPPWRRNRP